jgi:transposase-like protein
LKTSPTPKPTGGRKTCWTQAFKLAAVLRISEGAHVATLGKELGVRPELLCEWRRRYLSGGPQALRPMGRPSGGTRDVAAVLAPPLPAPAGTERGRIEELERKIGQQQPDLDFFRAALRHVREQRLRKGGLGGTASSR